MNIYMYIRVIRPLFVRFELKLNFLSGFSKNTQISNFMEIRPAKAELFLADGQTNRRT
jgi:hypothetical protein